MPRQEYERKSVLSGGKKVKIVKNFSLTRRERMQEMRKKVIVVAVLCSILLLGCQTMARDMGGTVEIQLEPNQKLEEITWNEDSLWYLTRPMTKDDVAETHVFRESSKFGALEGKVIIVESKE